MFRPPKLPCYAILAIALWLCGVIGVTYAVEFHESEPGKIAALGASWPNGAHPTRALDGPTIAFFAHPKCPCTRASLDELDRIVSRHQGKVKVLIYFIRPSGTDSSWQNGDLWSQAKRIPGAISVEDDKATEAKLFRAFTSGTTILFGNDGRELFRGGLTVSRGHEGESVGGDAIAEYLDSGAIKTHFAPVFGCALFSVSEAGANS